MKINRLVSAIFFFVVGLFSLASLQAQEAKTLFVNIPDSLTPLLTKVNREDCIDFLESKMKAQVENRFGKKSAFLYDRLETTCRFSVYLSTGDE